MKISYDELIKKINNHEISNVEFGIADYNIIAIAGLKLIRN